jgi:hypothetical protein
VVQIVQLTRIVAARLLLRCCGDIRSLVIKCGVRLAEWRIVDSVSSVHRVKREVVEPARWRAATTHFLEMIRLGRENWKPAVAQPIMTAINVKRIFRRAGRSDWCFRTRARHRRLAGARRHPFRSGMADDRASGRTAGLRDSPSGSTCWTGPAELNRPDNS